jgi:hypothetical protein
MDIISAGRLRGNTIATRGVIVVAFAIGNIRFRKIED